MQNSEQKTNLKGTWNQAILTFLFPIFLVMSLRWALIEPFVIPSGSMIPNLLVHDHVFVQKFAFGLHWPFSDSWMVRWSSPQRGQIIVFRYPENPDVYYIKRLVGLPGDKVEVSGRQVSINGKGLELTAVPFSKDDLNFDYFQEWDFEVPHIVRFLKDNESSETRIFNVPSKQYFFMGDNRDQSSDSRFWGFVDEKYIVGKAWMIWLSCESTLPTMSFVCDPSQIRFDRIFKWVR